MKMVLKALPFALNIVFFISRLLLKLHKNHRKFLKRNLSNNIHVPPPSPTSNFKPHHKSTFSSLRLAHTSPHLSQKTLIFDVEGTLLRSPSMFPYFMLVAFEAGSLVRALLLFLVYPLVCLVDEETGLKIMVMVCFFGIKKDGFRVGSAVLPKFFLEDVGMEGFEVLRRGGRKVGVSKLPQVMVESFLKDHLEIDFVFGRDLKVFRGYFLGLMKDVNNNNNDNIKRHLDQVLEHDYQQEEEGDGKVWSSLIGFHGSNMPMKHHWISYCKEVYVATDLEKMTWQPLPKERRPKPLVFHDGRLAFRPDPLPTLVMFMWFPFGLTLSVFRAIIALCLPYSASIPILEFTGMQLKLTHSNLISCSTQHKNRLYVCNHRTLLDPLYLSFGLKKPFAAVTYSLSRMSEILSPIRTVRLTRDRDQDAKMMQKMLKQGDLVVCPEGTTCREPYLLRFSPLFAELSDDIVPVALDTHVSMFYGTTAGGFKCLDPFLFLMNPCPVYGVRFLEMVRGVQSTSSGDDQRSRFDVANYVQREIGKTLEFECTNLTRKDKYLILAGNEGFVSAVVCNKR